MGTLTPNNNEYNLLSGFIKEALTLHGQECLVYTPVSIEPDANRDKIFYYSEPSPALILFADVLSNNKLKGKHWSKETGENIEAYISLEDSERIKVNSVIDITPAYYNQSAKFIVQKVEGQVNSIYLKVYLVPYRKSIAVDTVEEKDTSIKKMEGKTIVDRPFFKR